MRLDQESLDTLVPPPIDHLKLNTTRNNERTRKLNKRFITSYNIIDPGTMTMSCFILAFSMKKYSIPTMLACNNSATPNTNYYSSILVVFFGLKRVNCKV